MLKITDYEHSAGIIQSLQNAGYVDDPNLNSETIVRDGKEYKVLSRMKYDYSKMNIFFRGLLGVLAVIVTFGAAWYLAEATIHRLFYKRLTRIKVVCPITTTINTIATPLLSKEPSTVSDSSRSGSSSSLNNLSDREEDLAEEHIPVAAETTVLLPIISTTAFQSYSLSIKDEKFEVDSKERQDELVQHLVALGYSNYEKILVTRPFLDSPSSGVIWDDILEKLLSNHFGIEIRPHGLYLYPKVFKVKLDSRFVILDFSSIDKQNQALEILKSYIYPSHKIVTFDLDQPKSVRKPFIKILTLALSDFFTFTNRHSEYLKNLTPKVMEVQENEKEKIIKYWDGSWVHIEYTKMRWGEIKKKISRQLANGILETGDFLGGYGWYDINNYYGSFIRGLRHHPDGHVTRVFNCTALTSFFENGEEWIQSKGLEFKKYSKENLDNYETYKVISHSNDVLECLVITNSYPSFEPYECTVEIDKKVTHSISNEKEQESFITDLKAYIRLNPTSITLNLTSGVLLGRKRTSDYMPCFRRLKTILEQHFEIIGVNESSYEPSLLLGPKIKERKESDSTVTIIYESGVVFEYQRELSSPEPSEAFVGKRTFPNGMLEEGKFGVNGSYPFIEGACTFQNETHYIFTEECMYFKSEYIVAPLSTLEGIRAQTFQVLNLKSSDSFFKCIPSDKSVVDVTMDCLEEEELFYRLCFTKKLFSDEQLKTLIPRLFETSENLPNPPIFSVIRYCLEIIEKAKDFGIKLNLDVFKITNELKISFIEKYINKIIFYDDEIELDKCVAQLANLKEVDSDLFAKYAEYIFIEFAKVGVSLNNAYEFPFDSFTPAGKFIHKLIYDVKITTEDKESVPLFKYDDLLKISQVAQAYKKTGIIPFVKIYDRPRDHDSISYLYKR